MSNSRFNSLIVCDLDNTLYDWVSFFVPAFEAMVSEATRILGCSRETLLDDLRDVHQKHKDSEHPYALLETRTVQTLLAGTDADHMKRRLDPAFHAFNAARKNHLRLYPRVEETLDQLSSMGCVLVAHTESKFYSAVERLHRLKIKSYFKHVYCRERSSPPFTLEFCDDTRSRFEKDGSVTELFQHQSKPDPKVLVEICEREGFKTSQAIYVGDSMARDMLMANRAAVFAAWAKYGTSFDSDLYAKLVRITHWSDEDIKREQLHRADAASVVPDFVCDQGFFQVPAAVRAYLESRQCRV